MNKILCLCTNLLLFIISEAVPQKLIAGDHSVVKKDGATHRIFKYYVVPNDFNTNSVTNSTETSQTTLRMNHSLYSKSVDADTASQHQFSEKRAEAVSTGSANTEQNLGPDDLRNLQVVPIATNVNSSVATLLTEENTTQTFKRDVENKLEDFILTQFTAVQKSSVQNLESFWKLIKLNIDRISDDDELLTKIKKLSLLLNIFTNLYEAAQSQKPVESMIDSIINILQIPFVEIKKSNTYESQFQTDVTGDYDEECLRKCSQKLSKPQWDSNGMYRSETESQEASDNLELKNLDIKRQQRGDSDDGDDWVNTSNVPGSNEVAVTNPNIVRSQLLVPNNLNMGVPDGFNVRYSKPTPTLNHVARENDVQEDPKSKQTIPDSADIDEHLDDQPSTMKTRFTEMPWTIEDKSNKNLDNQPLPIESNLADDIMPWHIEDKKTDNLPRYIEDEPTNHQPLIIEHRTTNTLPWTIVDRETKKLPGNVKNRADPDWTIENKMGHSPKTLYQSRYPSVITHGGKTLLHPNQPMTGTVHSVKHGVKKPYHIYTYDINPEASLYEIPNSGNIVKVKSREHNANLKTRLDGLSTSHGGNKSLYANQPFPSYYESQFSLSKPSVDISSQTNIIQLNRTNYFTSTYDTSNEVNPSDLLYETTQDNNQPKLLVGHDTKTNHKAALLQPNTLTSDSQTNSDQENEVPQVPEVGSQPGVLLPNVPSTPFESLINLGNTEPVSPTSADSSDVNPDIGDTEPNPYNPNINLNRIQQTNLHLGLISKDSYYSAYTNLPDDYDESSPVDGEETHKHPDLISIASSGSAYTNLPDEYDEPLYSEQTHQHPNLITSSAASSNVYTNLPDEYDEPVYDEQTHKHPVLISIASSSSAYTNLPDEYDETVYSGQTHQHPTLIISSAASSPVYTNLPHEYVEAIYDEQTRKHPVLISIASSSSAYTKPDEYDEPVYSEQTHQHPTLITSSAASNSQYTNVVDDYDEPVYVAQTHQHPGLISSSALSNSEYTNVVDDYDKRSPVYGGQIYNYPGFISKAPADSEYNKPIPYYGGHTDRHPGLITKVSHYPEYANVVHGYDEPIPLYGGQIQKHPAFIFNSEYTNLPYEYNNPTSDYEGDIQKYPVHIQTPANGRPTKIEDNLLVSYPPYGHKVHVVQPSLIAHLHGNQPIGLNYHKHLKRKLAPTYRLFTIDNLLKLHDAVIKTIEVSGDKPDVYDSREMMNLWKIINIILIMAEHLEEPDGSIEWYEKIFYNTQKENRHPLETYVYNLIRQRWLHELMFVLYKNNLNFNILHNPRIFSFLGSWQFPNYVLNFMETEELLHHNFDALELFDQTFSSQYDLLVKFATHKYDDVLEKVPENLENYVTNNVIENYKTPNAGIVLSIAGVEADPDANAIIHILQKYLHYKSFIEKQENAIIRDNMIEMLKQIILFLREKGYDASTIADVIRKLYNAVYSTEGKGCQIHNTNVAKNMYDVILPVLRSRSGR